MTADNIFRWLHYWSAVIALLLIGGAIGAGQMAVWMADEIDARFVCTEKP